ncbi:MAG: winged helix-turn-helix transcriptional regulator [Lachnospiraceae bacterium]|nr:winged helix-turn-helix transcriptional regulator [Lachnospiraceae bacterium]
MSEKHIENHEHELHHHEHTGTCGHLHNHGGNLADLMASIPTEQQFFMAADVFSMLCDSTRLRILWLLCHTEECVSDIATAVDMSSPAVSHHLRNLKQSGLIVSRREGKEVLYTLAKTKEATLVHHMIDDIFEINCPR